MAINRMPINIKIEDEPLKVAIEDAVSAFKIIIQNAIVYPNREWTAKEIEEKAAEFTIAPTSLDDKFEVGYDPGDRDDKADAVAVLSGNIKLDEAPPASAPEMTEAKDRWYPPPTQRGGLGRSNYQKVYDLARELAYDREEEFQEIENNAKKRFQEIDAVEVNGNLYAKAKPPEQKPELQLVKPAVRRRMDA